MEIDSGTGSGRALGRWATVLIVAVVAIRCTVSIVPQVRFDADPAIDSLPYVGFGLVGSFALDVVLLIAGALAFTSEVRSGRRVSFWPFGLAILPGAVVFIHGRFDTIDLFRGSTWVAAAIAGVAAMHLARDPALRRLFIGGAVATLGLMAIRGGEQVLFEHAETVRAFEQSKAQFFAERGWDPAGAAARTYERRLRQPEATGWFGLSNIFSAAMAFGVVFCGGLLLERRRAGGIALMPALLFLGCAALVAVNGSKGAVVAAGLGFVACAIGWSRFSRFAPIVGIAIVAFAASAPALRGLLPESFAGERSLLFRAQYLDGAFRAVVETLPWGVGPDGFQDAYIRHKSARSPEDVQSAHAMAVDWLVMLGPIGLAWIALVAAALRRGGKTLVAEANPAPIGPNDAGVIAIAVLVATVTLLVGALGEVPILTPWWLIVRGLAAAVFVVTFVSIARCLVGRAGAIALWAGTVALLAQAQVEMVFFMPGLCVWAAVVIGTMAAARSGPAEATPARLSFAALGTAAFASLVVAFGLVPQVAQDSLMDQASETLGPVATLREAWPAARDELARGGVGADFVRLAEEVGGAGLAAELRQKVAAATTPPMRIAAAAGVIGSFERERRVMAAERLLAAREANPTNWHAERAAIEQLLAASRRDGVWDVTASSFAQALALADESTRHWQTPRFAALRAEIAYQWAKAAPDDATIGVALGVALDASQAALALEPLSVRRWSSEGDLRAAAAELDRAAAAWRHALELDTSRELDPLVQFSTAERAEIERKLKTVGDAASAPNGL